MTVMAGCTVCLLWRRLYFLIALFTADFFLQQSTISFSSKFELYKSLVTSVLLFGCETWTLLADSEERIQAFETKCLRKLLRISYLEHKTNDWVQSKINFLVDLQEPLLAAVTRRKLAWFGHLVWQPLLPSFKLHWRVGDAMVSGGNAR